MALSGKLDARKVRTLPLGPDGKVKSHSDGRGLVVIVEPGKDGPTRSFNYRFTFAGKEAIKRMGHVDELTLTDAREKAMEYRAMIVDGKDPRRVIDVTAAGQMTFKGYADRYWDELGVGKREREWRHAIEKVSKLHDRPIAEITLDDVKAAIKSYWAERPVNAERVVQKVGVIFDHARVRKLRLDNPANLKDLYRLGLEPARKNNPIEPHPALPFADLPAFMKRLAYQPELTARCLEFCILTGSRSGEARLARWEWLNEDMTVITMPKEIMKAKRAHAIPLSTQLTAMLRKLPRTSDLIFPSQHCFEKDQALRPDTLIQMVNRVHQGERISVHGFRSTFHDYATVNALEHDIVIEMSLAHVVGDTARRAYARDGLIDRRRPVMQAFADYATGKAAPANVVPFKSKVA